MECRIEGCRLELSSEEEYHHHLLIDHNQIHCPFCPNTSMKPKNYRKHLLQQHSTDWRSEKFLDAFVSKFGYDDNLFYFLRECSGFIPLTILRKILKRMMVISKNLFEVSDGFYISSDLDDDVNPSLDPPTLPAMSKTTSYIDIINKVTLLDILWHNLDYMTGKKHKRLTFVIDLALANLISYHKSLLPSTLTELMIIGLRLKQGHKYYLNSTSLVPYILTKVEEIKSLDRRVTLLFEIVRYFKSENIKDKSEEALRVLERIINEEIIIGKIRHQDQLRLVTLLLRDENQDAITYLEEYSKKYHDLLPHKKACDLVAIGKLYTSRNSYNKAKRSLLQAYQIFQKQEDFIRLINCGNLLIGACLKLEQYSEALNTINQLLDAIDPLKIDYLKKYKLKIVKLAINYHLLKDYSVKSFQDVKLVRGRIYSSYILLSELSDEISYESEEGLLDSYSEENIEKLHTKIDEVRKSFTLVEENLKLSENQIITEELIKLGLSTYSFVDKNFVIPEPSLRERLYEHLTNAENLLGYRFNHPHLLLQALLDTEMKIKSSTKLAFLGDAALKLALSEILIEHGNIDFSPDDLTKRRETVEKNVNLAVIFDNLGLGKCVLSTKKILPFEGGNDQFTEENVIKWKGTIVESIIGSIYFDGGISAVKRFFIGWKPQLFVNLQN